MKVAIVISGMHRYQSECLESLTKYLIKPLNADVYVHCWKDVAIHKDDDPSQSTKFEVTADYLGKIPNLVDFYIEENRAIPPLSDAEKCAVNTMSMFYKMEEAQKLVKSGYDMVIRTRMDLYYHSPLKVETVKLFLNTNCVIFPMHNVYCGANDQFFVANQEVMEYVCKIYSETPGYFEKGIYFHPESLLVHHLTQKKIDRKFLDIIHYSIQREGRRA